METLTKEIKEALRNRLLYAALVLALTLPDVCSALESEDGQTNLERYTAWCDIWLTQKYRKHLTANDLYRLRCGMTHQARLDHPGLPYARVFFTLRPNGSLFHRNTLKSTYGLKPGETAKSALNLDLHLFCKDVVESAEAWFEQKKSDPFVQTNLANLVQFHPNGVLPYLKGVPAVG